MTQEQYDEIINSYSVILNKAHGLNITIGIEANRCVNDLIKEYPDLEDARISRVKE